MESFIVGWEIYSVVKRALVMSLGLFYWLYARIVTYLGEVVVSARERFRRVVVRYHRLFSGGLRSCNTT